MVRGAPARQAQARTPSVHLQEHALTSAEAATTSAMNGSPLLLVMRLGDRDLQTSQAALPAAGGAAKPGASR